MWETRVQFNLSHATLALSICGTVHLHLLCGSLKCASDGSSSGISHVIYLVQGKLEYHCITKFGKCSPPQSAYGNSATSLNADVLKFCKRFSWTPFTWLSAKVSTPTANTVPRLTLKPLYSLSNLFRWKEKGVIVMMAHYNSIPVIKACRHKGF